MGNELNDQLENVFAKAVQQPRVERAAYIESACKGDGELRARVVSLLEAHDDAGGFLAEPTATLARPVAAAPAEGQRIGRYHIRRVIASGGMGVVYDAVQEKPHRTVALKVMRSGVASKSSLRRFEYESQILARLHHPNIAQVYEAGTHDDGTGPVPYFAMEYIPNARNIVEFADEKKLSIRQRLDLFTAVCDAVHYGHQKGIIHRDLKPANILVDSAGTPRIIDFGVARATDSDMAVTTLQTDVGQLIGTLQYMSPEQCDADPHDLDSRSDVYALGVVLYELLCSRLPYDIGNVAIHEAVRAIRENTPQKPSTFSRMLRGDLETIALKALAKERTRRYQSAADLGNDLGRFLDNQPITARPPSVSYQVRKFARRHKAVVVGVVGMLALLVAGTAVITWQTALTRAETSRAAAFKGFLTEMLGLTDSLRASRRLTLGDALDRAVEAIPDHLEGHREVEAEVRHLIGVSYTSLSMLDEATEQLRLARDIRRDLFGADHPSTLDSAFQLGDALRQGFDEAEAVGVFRSVLDAQDRVLGKDHADTLTTMSRLACALGRTGEYDEAEALGARSIAGLTALLGEEDERTLYARHLVAQYVFWWAGRWDRTLVEERAVYEISRRVLGDDHYVTNDSAYMLGLALTAVDRWDEGKSLMQWAVDANRRLWGADDQATLSWMEFFGWTLHLRGETEKGEPLLRRGVDGLRRVLGRRHLKTAYATDRLARMERDLGNDERAEDLMREVIDVQRESLGAEHPHVLDNMATLASWLQGNPEHSDEMDRLLQAQVDAYRRFDGHVDRQTLGAWNGLAWTLKDQGGDWPAEAEQIARRTVEQVNLHFANDHELVPLTVDTLAVILYQHGKRAEALDIFTELFAKRESFGENWVWRTSPGVYAKALTEVERYEEAVSLLTAALDGLEHLRGQEHELTRASRAALVEVYEAWGRPEAAEPYRRSAAPAGQE